MKKIALLLSMLFVLTACQKSTLEIIGYEKSDIYLIKQLTPAKQALFENSLNEDLLKLLHNDNFSEEKMDKYLILKEYFSGGQLDKILNDENVLNIDNNYLNEILKDDWFINDSFSLYIEEAIKDNALSSREVVERVNSLAYKKQYQDITPADIEKDLNVLVNKYHYLNEEFEPSDLVNFESQYCDGKTQSARKEVYDHFVEMYKEAEKDGIILTINSGYRSYNLQETTYNNFLLNDSLENVEIYSARAGYSEHQTGLALDILTPGYSFDNFEYSEAYYWLVSNASKYGFIIRYPKNKQKITGYKYESWHYRYVGKNIAEDIENSNITYDEYYAYRFGR